MAAISSTILKSKSHRKPNFQLIRDIDESGPCMKFEQNPLKMKKVIVCLRTRQMDGQLV